MRGIIGHGGVRYDFCNLLNVHITYFLLLTWQAATFGPVKSFWYMGRDGLELAEFQ